VQPRYRKEVRKWCFSRVWFLRVINYCLTDAGGLSRELVDLLLEDNEKNFS